MPTYDFLCKKCNESFSIVMSIREYEEKKVQCPKCASREVQQQVTPFMTKTSKKS